MDEILIGEKKYVSSKRAAKVTGYAKDYIGQLCREGRVPARLVGRSWYVLESAIHDHRFGKQEIGLNNSANSTRLPIVEPSSPVSAWESPRYEASPAEILPPVNRLHSEVGGPSKGDTDVLPDASSEISQDLQGSWRAWFDRVADTKPVDLAALTTSAEQEKREETSGIREETKEINIPVHTIYDLPPEDLLPHRRMEVELPRNVVTVQTQRRGRGIIGAAIQIAGAILAVLMAVVAIMGTGYLDRYIISNSQVSLITGVLLYNK